MVEPKLRSFFWFKAVFLLPVIIFGNEGLGQTPQVMNDHLQKYLQNRDWPKNFACAMFVELTVDDKDVRNANFSEHWYLYSRAFESNTIRLDSQRQSKFDLVGEFGQGLAYSFFSRGDESFLYVGNSPTPQDFSLSESSNADKDKSAHRLVYVNPFDLSFVGWAGFTEKDVPSARPDFLRRIFARYEETKSKKVRNIDICEFKLFPDDVVFDTIEFDAQSGGMPTTLIRESRNGAKINVQENIKTSWKSNDRTHWFPHELSIDLFVDKDTRKSWKVKYYWLLDDLGEELFDPTDGGVLRIEELRERIVGSAFNRRGN